MEMMSCMKRKRDLNEIQVSFVVVGRGIEPLLQDLES